MTELPRKTANIDVVAYRENARVLLARTESEFSIGLIKVLNFRLVCWLLNDLDPKTEITGATAVAIAKFNDSLDALELAKGLIEGWDANNVQNNENNFQIESIPKIRQEDILFLVEDADVDKPQLSHDGETRLPLADELKLQQDLKSVRDHGVMFPVDELLKAINSSFPPDLED